MHDDYNNKYNRVYNADNNGYNENYNTANNNIGKYNNYVTYNNNRQNNGVRDPGIPFEIYREHPEARLATKKDGRIPLVISSIICFVLLIIMGFTVFFTEQSRAETEKIMNYNETVDGVVMKTWKSNISTSNSKKGSYYASYMYTYNNKIYLGTTKINQGSLSKNQKVKVYVDPNNPSDSRLFHENVLWMYLILLSTIPFVLIWIFTLRRYYLCCRGRIVIYKVYSTNWPTGKTAWKKINRND